MPNEYANKIDSTQGYKVDSRITINQQRKPISSDVGTNIDKIVASGVRVNNTVWPSGT